MSAHEQFADDLALLALGALQGDERVTLEKHLEGCACLPPQELERLRGDLALLALSASGPAPPQRSRERLLKAMAKEPRAQKAAPRRSFSSWAIVPWLAALALLFVAAFFWQQSDRLAQRVAHLQDQSAQQQAQLERAREVVSTLTSTDAMRVTLVAAQNPPQPQGKAIYVKNRSSLIFLASNMPALPPQKIYELWLIPTNGAPIPAGVFKPDARGSATLVDPAATARRDRSQGFCDYRRTGAGILGAYNANCDDGRRRIDHPGTAALGCPGRARLDRLFAATKAAELRSAGQPTAAVPMWPALLRIGRGSAFLDHGNYHEKVKREAGCKYLRTCQHDDAW